MKPQGTNRYIARSKRVPHSEFFHLGGRMRVFEGGSYFIKNGNVGFFMQFCMQHYNHKNKDFHGALILVWIFSLPKKYWWEEILVSIDNAIDSFVKL